MKRTVWRVSMRIACYYWSKGDQYMNSNKLHHWQNSEWTWLYWITQRPFGSRHLIGKCPSDSKGLTIGDKCRKISTTEANKVIKTGKRKSLKIFKKVVGGLVPGRGNSSEAVLCPRSSEIESCSQVALLYYICMLANTKWAWIISANNASFGPEVTKANFVLRQKWPNYDKNDCVWWNTLTRIVFSKFSTKGNLTKID